MSVSDGNVTAGAASDVAAACENAVQCWVQENLFLTRLLLTLVVFLLAYTMVWLGDRTLTRSARRIAKLQRADEYRTTVLVGRTKPMRLTLRLLVVVASGLALLGIWGLQTAFTGLLAGAGFAGIVIGLAAADTIGDIVAGFLIFYNHPFDIGDWVEIDGVQGTVTDVELGATSILTFDNEKVTFPNRIVEGQKIKNFSHKRKLRRRLVVGVEYGSDLRRAMEILVEEAAAHPEVYKDPVPQAISLGFGASSVDLELRFWVEPVRSSAIQVHTDLVVAVHDRLRAQGIGIAFPHMQIVQPKPWIVEGAA